MRRPVLASRITTQGHPNCRFDNPSKLGETLMDDLLWISIMVGLLVVTLAYVRLCDNA
jgi:hypothetical protein